jgi:hypothetical protein
MPSLEMVQGDPPGRRNPLDGEVTVLDRDAACDIVLARHQVSKRHARVVHKDGGYYIEDLQSRNGTKVGGRGLTQARRLEDGDLIESGGFRLAFSGGGPTVLAALDASSTEEGEAARVRPEDKLGAVLEINRGLAGALGLEGVLGKALEALFRVFPLAERGFVLLRGEAAGEVVPAASKARHADGRTPLFSRTIFHHVVGEGRAIICKDAGADRRFGESESVTESGVRTMLCVPLSDGEGQPVGVLQIDTGPTGAGSRRTTWTCWRRWPGR